MGSTLRRVDFVQLVHVPQDLVQVRLKLAHFVVGQLEVGQVRHVPHFFFGDLHANAFVRAAR